MLYLREFEITEPDDNGLCAVLPFGLPGATQGEGFDNAMEMAADWLYHTVQDMLIRGEEVPEPHFGNDSENGGKVVTVAVDVDLSRADAVTAADAARKGVASTSMALVSGSKPRIWEPSASTAASPPNTRGQNPGARSSFRAVRA